MKLLFSNVKIVIHWPKPLRSKKKHGIRYNSNDKIDWIEYYYQAKNKKDDICIKHVKWTGLKGFDNILIPKTK